MAQTDVFKRYLDAGVALTALTQAKAEGIVKDLVKTGELQAGQAQKAAQDLVERSRRNTEKLVDQVRKEVRSSVNSLGLATKADITRLEKQIASLKGTGAKAPAKKAPAKKAPARKATARKAPARKRTAS